MGINLLEKKALSSLGMRVRKVTLRACRIPSINMELSTTFHTFEPTTNQKCWKKSNIKPFGPRDFPIVISMIVASTYSKEISLMRLEFWLGMTIWGMFYQINLITSCLSISIVDTQTIWGSPTYENFHSIKETSLLELARSQRANAHGWMCPSNYILDRISWAHHAMVWFIFMFFIHCVFFYAHVSLGAQ